MPAKARRSDTFDPFILEVADAVASRLKPELLRDAPKEQPRPAPPPAPPTTPGRSETIDQYCSRKQISRAHYYDLRKQGLGPREERFGKSVRIPPQPDDNAA